MANEVQTSSEPTMTGLLRGIITDIGDLIREEMRFARAEIRSDLKKTWGATAVLALGAGASALAVLLLALMLVFLLHWLTAPAGTDQATLPLWGCFGIWAGVIGLGGAALCWLGYKKFQSFNPLPVQTAQTVKENVEWLTNSK
jgi:H+/Cl- antiporter ClcA